MPIRPRSGSDFAVRHRKSWSSSSADGALNEKTWQPCGLTPGHDVLDRAVLAGRVHGLEDEQHAPLVLGVELLLRRREALDALLQVLRRLFLRLHAPAVVRLDLREAEALPLRDPEGLQELVEPLAALLGGPLLLGHRWHLPLVRACPKETPSCRRRPVRQVDADGEVTGIGADIGGPSGNSLPSISSSPQGLSGLESCPVYPSTIQDLTPLGQGDGPLARSSCV